MIRKKRISGPDTGSGPGPKDINIKSFLKKNDKILKLKESWEWEERGSDGHDSCWMVICATSISVLIILMCIIFL